MQMTTIEIQQRIRQAMELLEDIQEYCYENDHEVELYHTLDDLEQLDIELGRPTQ